MNYESKINQLDEIILHLRDFKKELNRTQKLSDKVRDMDWQSNGRNQMQRASTNLNWACMNLDKQHKRTWRKIKESFLETNLEETEYNPSMFHKYKG